MDDLDKILNIIITYNDENLTIKTKDFIALDELKQKSLKQFNLTKISKNLLKFHIEKDILSDDDLLKNIDFSDFNDTKLELKLTIDEGEKSNNSNFNKDKILNESITNDYIDIINQLEEANLKFSEENIKYTQIIKEKENNIKYLNEFNDQLKKNINDLTNKINELERENDKLNKAINNLKINNKDNDFNNYNKKKVISPGSKAFPEMNNNNNIFQNKEENIIKNDQNLTPTGMQTPNQKENNVKTNKMPEIYQTSEIKNNNRTRTDNIFYLNINQRNSNEIKEINAKGIKNEKIYSKLNNNDNNYRNFENKNNIFGKNTKQIIIPKLNFNKESDNSKENEIKYLKLQKRRSNEKLNFSNIMDDNIDYNDYKCQTERTDIIREMKRKYPDLNEIPDEKIIEKYEDNDGDVDLPKFIKSEINFTKLNLIKAKTIRSLILIIIMI